jgi:glycosyltransferase involved in cell wall biosynthesis
MEKSSRKRVLIVSNHRYSFGLNSFYNGGGWVKAFHDYLAYHTDLDITVAYICSSGSRFTDNITGIDYIPVYTHANRFIKRLLKTPLRSLLLRSLQTQYVKVLENINPDIIHVFGFESYFYELFATQKYDHKIIYQIQGILPVISDNFFPLNMRAVELIYHGRIMREVFLNNGILSEMKTLKRRSAMFLEQSYKIQNVIGRTRFDELYMKNLSKDVRYYKVWEMLRPNFYQELPVRKQKSDKLLLLSVVSDVFYKGNELIISTAHILESAKIDYEWRVVGIDDTSYVSYVFANWLSTDIPESVQYVGRLEAKDLIKEYMAADMYIHPSRIENSSNAIAEAMFCGLPAVAFDVGGNSSLLVGELSQLLVEAVNADALAKKILFLLSNAELLEHLGYTAKVLAEERYSKKNILTNTIETYNQILSHS